MARHRQESPASANSPANSATDKNREMTTLFDEVRFSHGPSMSNRFMLAPLTNSQSNADGTLSDDEHHWLTMQIGRAHV